MSHQRLSGIVVCLLCAPLPGASTISYELQIGGDNHVAQWEAYNNPAFTPGRPGDAIIDCDIDDCTAITWSAVVEVSGLHHDGYETNGAANLVFDLELRDDQNALVEEVTFHSTMNDGDADGLRGIIEGPDPLEMAAFCLVFGQDNPATFFPDQPAIEGSGPPNSPGRAFDDDAAGGPYMRRAQFPTVGSHGGGRLDQAGNHVAGGTPVAGLGEGRLIGMGCGYPQFNPVENGGPATAGVGIDPFDYGIICGRGLGHLAIVEGQIDIRALPWGEYTLSIVPGVGNNIMPGSYDCQYAFKPTAFAEAADQVIGDAIALTFFWWPPPVRIVAWRSVRDHGPGCGELAIELDPGIDTGCPVTEPRQGGIQRIEVDFERDATPFYMPGQAILSGGAAAVVNEALINGGTTLVLDIEGSVDQTCYLIDLLLCFYVWEGDMDCRVATLAGDTNGDCIVSSLDRAQLKASSGLPASVNPRVDVNGDCIISSLDRALGKAMSGHSVSCP